MSREIEIPLPAPNVGETTPYCLVGRVTAKPDQADALEARLGSLVEPTRQEDGVIHYHVHRDRMDPNLFVFYEAWVTREALIEHIKKPYIQSFLLDAHQYFDGEMEINWLLLTSEME